MHAKPPVFSNLVIMQIRRSPQGIQKNDHNNGAPPGRRLRDSCNVKYGQNTTCDIHFECRYLGWPVLYHPRGFFTIGPARGTRVEAIRHHRNPFPICQRVAASEGCRLNLRSPGEKTQHSFPRGTAAGFPVFSGPDSSGEVRRGYPHRRGSAVPLLR